MKRLITIGFLLVSIPSIGQNEVLGKIPSAGKSIKDFIPAGYDTLATASGDLNKDKLIDYVMVLGSTEEQVKEIEEYPERLMIILFKTATGYKLATKTAKAILCKDCGGVYGDPLAGVSIANGVLELDHYGGSAWRWAYKHKFRWQQNSFYLIGETSNYYWNVSMCDSIAEFAGTEYLDINYLTGQFVEKKVSEEDCKFLVNKKGKKKVQPLKKLTAFSIEN